MVCIFQTRCHIESVERVKTPLNPSSTPLALEPEEHIELYGIDHYLKTIFPYDTDEQRMIRKDHLLSFHCLYVKQQIYKNSH